MTIPPFDDTLILSQFSEFVKRKVSL